MGLEKIEERNGSNFSDRDAKKARNPTKLGCDYHFKAEQCLDIRYYVERMSSGDLTIPMGYVPFPVDACCSPELKLLAEIGDKRSYLRYHKIDSLLIRR